MASATHATDIDRSQQLYEMLLEAIPSSVLLIDRQMRVISANRNFLEKSQRSLADTISRPVSQVFPAVILSEMSLLERLREVFETNQATPGERMAYRSPRVPLRTYYYRILPFSCGEEVESAMLLMDDVTEQVRLSGEIRRVLRHLASVVESASDIVLSTDTRGRLVSWNSAAQGISGYTLEEVTDEPLYRFCAEKHHEEVRRAFSNRVKPRGSVMAEWELMTKLGQPRPFSWVCSPMRDDDGETVGFVAVGRDLTEHRKSEMQLLQSQKLAALGVMAGGIAHEVRNPLAIASSAAQFLAKDHLSVRFRKECVGKILEGIQRASKIIENLLRFARPSEKFNADSIEIAGLLKETLSLVTNQARIQKIKIQQRLSRESASVSGIHSFLQQAFMNLFINAIKAMPDGGVLAVTVATTDSEVAVSIADSGHGISQEELGKIFDPFYSTSPVGQGTGLGLSLCHSIIKQHFGTVEVESEAGKGSTFTVRLPLM